MKTLADARTRRPGPWLPAGAVLGAVLVVAGAFRTVVNIPVIDALNLFQIDRTAGWVATGCAVLTAALLCFRKLRPWAWFTWAGSAAALAFIAFNVFSQVRQLKEQLAQNPSYAARPEMIDQMIGNSTLLAGAHLILAGLVIQGVALLVGIMTKRRHR